MKIDPAASRSKGKTFYISDLHIGHKAIIQIDKRPFSSYDEMYTTIINNWNSVVSDDDKVFILGDFSFSTNIALDVIKQLKGRKYIVLGNHDRLNSELRSHFEEIVDYYETVDTLNKQSTRVILSHYPIAHWNHQFHNAIHMYGHVHNNDDYKMFNKYLEMIRNELHIEANAFNCGCMLPYMDYTPRTLQEIYDCNRKIEANE